MARGVNKAIIIGNLGNDPEMRYLPNGTAVATISVATSESWTDKNTGQPQERTEWHRIEAFGRLAEIMGQYLRKGSKVYVEGSIRTDKWQDQTGADRYSTKIRANELQMLDSRQGSTDFGHNQAPNQAPNPVQNNYGGGAPQQQPYQQSQPTQAPQPQNNQFNQPFEAPKVDDADDFSDDIPF